VAKMKDRELHGKWVTGLRDKEKYQQTTDTLRDSSGFYCLGVLCDVAKKSWTKEFKSSAYDPKKYTLRQMGGLPPWLAGRFFGAEEHAAGPVITLGGEEATLADHNDAGRTFEEIAQAIEDQL